MQRRIKISILDNDVSRLIALMLWFEQFQEIQVKGFKADADLLSQDRSLIESDIVLLSDTALVSLDSVVEKTLKFGAESCSVFLLKNSHGPDRQPPVDCEASISMNASLKDLYDQIGKVAVRKKLVFASTWLPASKAS